MDTIDRIVSTRELRDNLSEVVSRTMFAGERVGVTRNGTLAAVVVSIDDLRAIEELELSADLAAYREAKAADDGTRIPLTELKNSLLTRDRSDVPS